MKKVFISHSSKDKATGDEVCRFLEANGISCWIAPRDVTPGKNYGSSETFSLEDKMRLQRFELRHPVVTYSAKIEILAVYRSERHDEMAISEIAFNRD